MANPTAPTIRRWLRNITGLLAAVAGLLVGVLALTFTLRADGNPSILTVSFEGYPTISAAIDAASSGDTIRVVPGVYTESLVIDTQVSIEATANGVWIDGDCSLLNGAQVHANGVTLRGIGIRKTDEAGIRIDGADDVTIEDITVQDFNCDDDDDQFEAGIAVWEGRGCGSPGARSFAGRRLMAVQKDSGTAYG